MLTTSAWLVRAVRIVAAVAPFLFALAPSAVAPASAHANVKSELRCLATAIYFEARGESERGQRAVADVIIARTKTLGYPKSICGVVYEGAHRRTGCQFSFACDGRAEIIREHECWQRAKRIAATAMSARGSSVRGATYFAVRSIHPRWATHMVRVARIGTHVFYRPRVAAVQVAAR